MKCVSPWLAECKSCAFLCSNLQAGSGTGIDGLELLRRSNFQIVLDQIGEHTQLQGKLLLEVGSAKGWFLEAARERGAKAQGIEPELANAELAIDHGFDVVIGLFPDDLKDQGPYDIVVFNDVLEHIPDPHKAMLHVEAVLAPGGLAVVNLPSSRGALFRIARLLSRFGVNGPYDRMWQKGFPSPHVSYFNPSNLMRMVESNTHLRQVGATALPSVTRKGLWSRIRSSESTISAVPIFCSVWLLTFILGFLPNDIHVAIFKKQNIA
ncbi:MAG: class I SAM-dependent methyltransferase [Pseudomonadota bacterium]